MPENLTLLYGGICQILLECDTRKAMLVVFGLALIEIETW
jgi:hypothetical protein